jgi:hypothetical protein
MRSENPRSEKTQALQIAHRRQLELRLGVPAFVQGFSQMNQGRHVMATGEVACGAEAGRVKRVDGVWRDRWA